MSDKPEEIVARDIANSNFVESTVASTLLGLELFMALDKACLEQLKSLDSKSFDYYLELLKLNNPFYSDVLSQYEKDTNNKAISDNFNFAQLKARGDDVSLDYISAVSLQDLLNSPIIKKCFIKYTLGLSQALQFCQTLTPKHRIGAIPGEFKFPVLKKKGDKYPRFDSFMARIRGLNCSHIDNYLMSLFDMSNEIAPVKVDINRIAQFIIKNSLEMVSYIDKHLIEEIILSSAKHQSTTLDKVNSDNLMVFNLPDDYHLDFTGSTRVTVNPISINTDHFSPAHIDPVSGKPSKTIGYTFIEKKKATVATNIAFHTNTVPANTNEKKGINGDRLLSLVGAESFNMMERPDLLIVNQATGEILTNSELFKRKVEVDQNLKITFTGYLGTVEGINIVVSKLLDGHNLAILGSRYMIGYGFAEINNLSVHTNYQTVDSTKIINIAELDKTKPTGYTIGYVIRDAVGISLERNAKAEVVFHPSKLIAIIENNT